MARKKTTQIEEDLPDRTIPAFFHKRQGQVKIARVQPRDGYLGRVDASEVSDLDDYLQENWGGGKYTVTYVPPIEAPDQSEFSQTIQISGRPRKSGDGDGGGGGAYRELLEQQMSENRELRAILEQANIDHRKRIAEDYSGLLTQQGKAHEDSTTRLVAMMEAGAQRDAQRHEQMMTSQREGFSQDMERGRAHTQESIALLSAAMQQQSATGQIDQITGILGAVKGFLPEPDPGGPLERLIDKSPDLVSGIADGLKSVSEARERSHARRERKKLPATNKGNGKGGAAQIAQDQQPAGDGFAGSSAAPDNAPAGDDGAVEQEKLTEADLYWSEFEGWFNTITCFDPSTWLEIVAAQQGQGVLPEILEEPIEKAMKGDTSDLEKLFEEMDATDLLEQFQATLPQQIAALKKKLEAQEAAEAAAGDGGGKGESGTG